MLNNRHPITNIREVQQEKSKNLQPETPQTPTNPFAEQATARKIMIEKLNNERRMLIEQHKQMSKLKQQEKSQTPQPTQLNPTNQSSQLNQQIAEKNRTIETLIKQKENSADQLHKLTEQYKQQDSIKQQETVRLKDELRKKDDLVNALKKDKQNAQNAQIKLQEEVKGLRKSIQDLQQTKALEQKQQHQKLQTVEQQTKQHEAKMTEFKNELDHYYELMQAIWRENKSLQQAQEHPMELVLLQAAKTGGLQETNFALASGVNVEAKNQEGKTALFVALEHNHQDIANLLIKAGASLAQAANQKSILQYLAEQDDLAKLKFVLDEYSDKTIPIDVLHAALQAAHSPEAKQYLAKPLFFQAAQLGDAINADLALACGIDKNQKDAKNNTALHYAAANDRVEMVNYLLNKDCSVNIKNTLGLLASELTTEPTIVKAFQDYQHKVDQVTKIQATYRGFFARRQDQLGALKQELDERVEKLLPELEANKDYLTISHLVSAREEKRYPDLKGMLDRLDELAKEAKTSSVKLN